MKLRTLKELTERANNINKTTKEERTGLSLLNYYIEKLENANNYTTMCYASDTIYGILLGLQMSGYINQEEFVNLDKDRENLQEKYFERTMD